MTDTTTITEPDPPKKRRGRWKPGESGNPKGRAKGVNTIADLRLELKEHTRKIAGKLFQQAMQGDLVASRILLDRTFPPLRSIDEPLTMKLPDDNLVGQARAVLLAMARGEITPGQAGEVLSAMGNVAKVVETHELAVRVESLEAVAGHTP